MSIKGIDAQIMLMRTAEVTREAAALKKNELTHDYLAIQLQAEEKAEKERVPKTIKTEKAGLHLDADRESKKERRKSSERGIHKEAGPESEGLQIRVEETEFESDSTFDIKI